MACDWIKGAMRRAMAMALLCAVIMAPVILSVTHGPGSVADAMQAVAVQVAHGHSHDWEDPGKPGQHDATDHEHNVAVVLPSEALSVFELTSAVFASEFGFSAGVSGNGLRRPPRDSIA